MPIRIRRRSRRGASSGMTSEDTGRDDAAMAPVVDSRVMEELRALPQLAPLRDDPCVWVVGGAVRDVLLGRPVVEADVVVEGDARAVAERAGLAVEEVHERFGTVKAGGLDLAGARAETYPAPGALPVVSLGVPVREDLARRDFTVNAIAVRLCDGACEAWDGALEDLAARVLRVLHPGSFLDDPTRLLRLVRYAARLGFAPSPETAVAASDAIRAGALATVSAPRVGAELRLALREPQPATLSLLSSLGLADHVIEGMSVDADAVAGAVALADGGRADLVALAVCVREIDSGVLSGRLDALEFPGGERDLVVRASRELAVDLGEPASALWRRLHALPLEVVAATGSAEVVERWRALRGARPAINGDDLVAAGVSGPAVGIGLDAAMAALLDDGVADREGQLAAALRAARG